MKISVIGTGYVGLVSGVLFAHLGHQVTCLDKDKNKIDLLNQGKSLIYEPNLEQYIKSAKNNITFSCGTIPDSDVIFIAVGTPQGDDGNADLSYVYSALADIAKYINDRSILVVKSTVPPGSCNKFKKFMEDHGCMNKIVFNPEFLREGSAVYDFLNPDRIVLGGICKASQETIKDVYKSIDTKFVFTDLVTAEMIKYASNAFLATKIGFINEMSNICGKLGANINDLSYGIGLDKRIGKQHLKPGPGFGGSCFPKDLSALSYISKINNINTEIINAVINANQNRKYLMFNKIKEVLNGINKKDMGVLGLSYKKDTDDVRSSPAIDIVKLLIDEGAIVHAYDPAAMDNAKKLFPQIKYYDSVKELYNSNKIIIILTEWDEFKVYNFMESHHIIIDLRNLLNPQSVLVKKGKYISL